MVDGVKWEVHVRSKGHRRMSGKPKRGEPQAPGARPDDEITGTSEGEGGETSPAGVA